MNTQSKFYIRNEIIKQMAAIDAKYCQGSKADQRREYALHLKQLRALMGRFG